MLGGHWAKSQKRSTDFGMPQLPFKRPFALFAAPQMHSTAQETSDVKKIEGVSRGPMKTPPMQTLTQADALAKASNFLMMQQQQRRKADVSGEAASKQVLQPAPSVAGCETGDSGAAEGTAVGEGGEFRCKSCLRGPPLTKKYAKNQCQTCYKKEKRI